MRVIWWRINRPDRPESPTYEAFGDSLTLKVPDDWVPKVPLKPEHVEEDWLTRLLKWSERDD